MNKYYVGRIVEFVKGIIILAPWKLLDVTNIPRQHCMVAVSFTYLTSLM